jgi:hypothetical protein
VTIQHVVNLSGGIPSWAAARRVVERYGTENVTLIFADTRIEDEDNYRFLQDAAADLGLPLTTVADGRTPWEVFKDTRFLGNARNAACSRILKRDQIEKWLAANCDPATTIQYLGIESSSADMARIPRIIEGCKPWRVAFPLVDWSPPLDKRACFRLAEERDLDPPRLYDLGFAHANCGGGCVRAGQAQFVHLRRKLPERFKEWMENEEEIRQFLGRDDIAILRDRRGGDTRPLTLAQLNERPEQADLFDWGQGCACFTAAYEGEE